MKGPRDISLTKGGKLYFCSLFVGFPESLVRRVQFWKRIQEIQGDIWWAVNQQTLKKNVKTTIITH